MAAAINFLKRFYNHIYWLILASYENRRFLESDSCKKTIKNDPLLGNYGLQDPNKVFFS